jgi:hypothetical protein
VPVKTGILEDKIKRNSSYYLHVYGGLNDVPEMRQIVVGK